MEFTAVDKNLKNGANMGSIAQYIYFGKYEDVATWPTRPSNPATIDANGVLTGDLVMKSTKQMFPLYLTDDTGEFKIEMVGENDGKSYVMRVSLFHPGLQSKILGFLNYAKNENLVIIARDNDDQLYLLGDEVRPAIFSGSPDGAGTGKETASRRGVSMEFTFKSANIYVYAGSVPLTPAT